MFRGLEGLNMAVNSPRTSPERDASATGGDGPEFGCAMLETRFLIAPTRLETSELRAVLPRLGAEWKPALLEAERAFLRCAGVEGAPLAAVVRSGGAANRQEHLRSAIGAELFFRDRDVYYLITKPEGRGFWRPPAAGNEGAEPEVEAGLISPTAAGMQERLERFAEALRAAYGEGGERFAWRKDLPATPRLEALAASEEGSAGRLTPARLGLVELEYARMLAVPLPRRIMRDLLRAGFARERDLLGLEQADPEMVRRAVEELQEVGLVEAEFLLECKQDRHPLIRAKSRRQLESAEVAALSCPVCRAPFGSELVVSVFSPTETSRAICGQSQWLRIWLTDRLHQMGVPLNALRWRETGGQEHAEVLAEFLGRLWIFALKDGAWGADDSYALNYRRVRSGADHVVAIATGGIAGEAARLLTEPAEDTAPMAACVSGLEAAPAALERELAAAAAEYARRRLRPVEEITSFDLSALPVWRQVGSGGAIRVVRPPLAAGA